MGTSFRGIKHLQYGIARQVATSEAPVKPQPAFFFFSEVNCHKSSGKLVILRNPKDPAVLKILRVVNLPRVVFLLAPCDLLSRRTLCGHHFPGNYRPFPAPRRVRVVVNLGGVVKTLRRSNLTIFAVVAAFSVWKGPLGTGRRTANLDHTSAPTSGPTSGPTSVPTRALTRRPTKASTEVPTKVSNQVVEVDQLQGSTTPNPETPRKEPKSSSPEPNPKFP